MDELSTTPVVHYFDTELHRILCGVRGADYRSTKHARGVSCQACVGLMGKRSSASLHPRPAEHGAITHAHDPS